MELDALLQLIFGIIATLLMIVGFRFSLRACRRMTLLHWRPSFTAVGSADHLSGINRRRLEPILPVTNPVQSSLARRTNYIVELHMVQDWIGQHAAAWSIGREPRVHRVADT